MGKRSRAAVLATAVEDLLARAALLEEAADRLRTTALELKTAVTEVSVFVEAELIKVHPPVCRKCGARCVLKKNFETGGHFWGCSTWRATKCKGGTDYQTWRIEAAQKLVEDELPSQQPAEPDPT
jgi:ribosomal protein L40E